MLRIAGQTTFGGPLYPIRCVALSAENGHPEEKTRGKAEWGRIKGGTLLFEFKAYFTDFVVDLLDPHGLCIQGCQLTDRQPAILPLADHLRTAKHEGTTAQRFVNDQTWHIQSIRPM